MNTQQIYNCLKSQLHDAFLGVYPRDQMPLHVPPGTGMVLNIENHDQPGMHWVALYNDKNSGLEFWDSYGIPPYVYGIRPPDKQFDMSTRTIQCANTAVCGEYCMFYLLHRAMNWSLLEIVNYFSSKHCIVNDRSVLRFVNARFHSHLSLYNDKPHQSSVRMHDALNRLYR